jgi:hypothetical protein
MLMPSLVNTASKVSVNVLSRSLIKNLKLAAGSPRSIRKSRACWAAQAPLGFAVMPRMGTRRVACSTTNSTDNRGSSGVSTLKKSVARIPWAWAVRKPRRVGPLRRGGGSMPARFRISHTVLGAR